MGTTEISRDELVALCEAGIVPEEKWSNRDSYSSQTKLGMAWALLKAGCDFKVLYADPESPSWSLGTDEDTIWIEIYSKGFHYFEWGEGKEEDTFYIPTRKRLKSRKGRDWY